MIVLPVLKENGVWNSKYCNYSSVNLIGWSLYEISLIIIKERKDHQREKELIMRDIEQKSYLVKLEHEKELLKERSNNADVKENFDMERSLRGGQLHSSFLKQDKTSPQVQNAQRWPTGAQDKDRGDCEDWQKKRGKRLHNPMLRVWTEVTQLGILSEFDNR